ncbi:translation initiation factor IF-2-like [Orcinus orca]|uniref:translation initiation factor IF-2-like n=1 Tax=Orcinus orca TaxID=9733 RepID=UPI0021113094|nr:translation initiation factor IF-2-like [Orcinus orca]
MKLLSTVSSGVLAPALPGRPTPAGAPPPSPRVCNCDWPHTTPDPDSKGKWGHSCRHTSRDSPGGRPQGPALRKLEDGLGFFPVRAPKAAPHPDCTASWKRRSRICRRETGNHSADSIRLCGAAKRRQEAKVSFLQVKLPHNPRDGLYSLSEPFGQVEAPGGQAPGGGRRSAPVSVPGFPRRNQADCQAARRPRTCPALLPRAAPAPGQSARCAPRGRPGPTPDSARGAAGQGLAIATLPAPQRRCCHCPGPGGAGPRCAPDPARGTRVPPRGSHSPRPPGVSPRRVRSPQPSRGAESGSRPYRLERGARAGRTPRGLAERSAGPERRRRRGGAGGRRRPLSARSRESSARRALGPWTPVRSSAPFNRARHPASSPELLRKSGRGRLLGVRPPPAPRAGRTGPGSSALLRVPESPEHPGSPRPQPPGRPGPSGAKLSLGSLRFWGEGEVKGSLSLLLLLFLRGPVQEHGRSQSSGLIFIFNFFLFEE